MTNLTNTREQPASQKASHSLLISFSPPRPKAKKQRPPRSDCDCTCALFDRTMLPPLSLAEWGINTVVVVVVTLIIIWRPSGMCSVHRLFQLNEMSPKKHCDMSLSMTFLPQIGRLIQKYEEIGHVWMWYARGRHISWRFLQVSPADGC